ncbi:DUF2157 domain-containing protein [Flavobacterium degerlachei]|jgi:hypothetical protein|uniref:Predicted membrane protein n=1 Tax=Flavobacterium degerlachei TaxID=229203 RepID=A0A1H3FM84_9FLAO|nr:DUF2157 domain-containing protein [Flavobacterium degerlachei]SDX91498.1 Predicted membrane protein [Flavobacterium degerlachei]
MKRFEENSTNRLFEKSLIDREQMDQISEYRALNVFSVHTELKLFLYLSVLLFTSGIGILIYENIDSIGHIAILSLLLIVTIICYYFSFKNAVGFKKQQTSFENPLFDYLILAAILLSCIFIGYLQFQYTAFGTHYGLATLIPTVIALFCAYYFDNKSILSIAITGLAAYIGLSVSPQALLDNNFQQSDSLSYSAIALGIVLIVWSIYSTKIELKKHFNLVFLTFALHLINISCINNLFEPYWGVFIILLAVSSYYFYTVSYSIKSVSLFVFTILYAYFGLNFLLFKIIDLIDIQDLMILFSFLVPFYFIASIILFIRLIKKFNKNKTDDCTR